MEAALSISRNGVAVRPSVAGVAGRLDELAHADDQYYHSPEVLGMMRSDDRFQELDGLIQTLEHDLKMCNDARGARKHLASLIRYKLQSAQESVPIFAGFTVHLSHFRSQLYRMINSRSTAGSENGVGKLA